MNGKEKITDCPSVNDGNWHHIAVTWTCRDGAWKVYIDGKLSDGGSGLSVGSKIPGMLYFYYTTFGCLNSVFIAEYARKCFGVFMIYAYVQHF